MQDHLLGNTAGLHRQGGGPWGVRTTADFPRCVWRSIPVLAGKDNLAGSGAGRRHDADDGRILGISEGRKVCPDDWSVVTAEDWA